MADNGLVPDVFRRRAPSFRSSSALRKLCCCYCITLITQYLQLLTNLPFFPLLNGIEENTKNGNLFDTRTMRLSLKL